MKTIIFWLVGGYGVYCLLLFALQRQMIFPRYAIDPAGDDHPPADVKVVRLDTGRDRVDAWYLAPPSADGPAPALLVAHGNAETLASSYLDFEAAAALGMAVLIIEYPGYGRSTGSPSQKSITAAMMAAYDYLARRPEVDARRIVGLGRSLGGGAVCTLVGRRDLAALVLVSTFTSVRRFARGYLVPGWLVRDPFDNLAAVRRFDRPVLVIHGQSDDTIPANHGEALARASTDGRLIRYDCGHNDMPPDDQRFWQDVGEFFRTKLYLD